MAQSRCQPPSAQEPLLILVVGECGDGKSTVINNLTGRQDAQTGRCARGITKDITVHKVSGLLDGREVWLLDTPGIGDKDIDAMKLLSMIEAQMAAGTMLDGVVVTTPVTDGRVKLGAQVVQALVDKGFVSDDKWKHIILNGTKMDRAEPEDLEFFKTELKRDFFEDAKPGHGYVSMTSKGDVSQLVQAFQQLPAAKVRYQKPDVEIMSKALASRMGIDEDIFKEKLNAARSELEQERRQKQEALMQAAEERRCKDAALMRVAEEQRARQVAEEDRLKAQRLADEARAAHRHSGGGGLSIGLGPVSLRIF